MNGWWTRYIGRRATEIHGLHGCKSTLCMVLMVRARSKDNVLKSQAVLKIVQCFLFIKQKSFVLDKGPLVEIPMVSFSLWA